MTRRQASVLVVGVILLVVAATGGLALRTKPTGPVMWTAALDGFPQSIVVDAQTHRAFVTTASLALGTGNARMIVLDTDTGVILRRITLGGNGSPPPVLDERAGRVVVAAFVYVRSGPGSPGVAGIVRMLDARSGAPVRTVRVGLFPRGLAVDEQTGRAFVASDGVGGAGLVGVLDTRTGRLLRIVHVDLQPQAQIVVDRRQGRVFVPAFSRRGYWHVSVLDARTGRPLYSIAASTPPVWVAEDAHTGRAFVADGSSTGLRVLDARNGHLLRIILSGQHAAQVVVDERADRAFVSTPAGMSVLDTRSGAVLRSIAMGGYPGEMLVDARDGRVFVVPPYTARGGQNVLSVLDARSGTLVRTVTLAGSAGAIAVDERAQRVLVFTVTRTGVPPATTGTMTILDARSGAILRVMPAHVPGAWMAVVDERTGHVFVLDGPHTVALPDPWTWLPVWLRRRLPLVPAPGRYTRVVPGGVRMIDSMR